MPTIVLGTDEVDCFCAWVSAEAGLSEHAEVGSDLKVRELLLLELKLKLELLFKKNLHFSF